MGGVFGVAVEAFDGVAQGGVVLVPGGAAVRQVLAVAGAQVGGDGDRGLAAEPGWVLRGLEDFAPPVARCQRGGAQRAGQPGVAAGGWAGKALVAVGVGAVFVLELVTGPGGDLLVVELTGDEVIMQAGGGGDQRPGQGGARQYQVPSTRMAPPRPLLDGGGSVRPRRSSLSSAAG